MICLNESDEEVQRMLIRGEGRDTGVETRPGVENRSNFNG